MSSVRRGAWIVTGAAAVALGVSALDCAAPTQIVIDLRTDSALCSELATGVAVTTRALIDSEPLEVFDRACKSGDRVGTLTITPSGAHDDWVGIRVVGAVGGKTPDLCGARSASGEASWTDCILARRRVRFAPGKTVNLTIRLTQACVSRYCGGDLECSVGACVSQDDATSHDNQPTQSEDSGERKPPFQSPDGAVSDASVPSVDASVPDASDAGQDPCALCKGTSCVAGTCTYDCNGPTACDGKELCAPGLDCIIKCSPSGRCRNTRCTTGGTCTYDCNGQGSGGSGPACAGIECTAGVCNVTCRGAEFACSGVTVSGTSNNVTCMPHKNDKASCNNMTCSTGTCVRDCGALTLGCGEQSTCSGMCSAWETAK